MLRLALILTLFQFTTPCVDFFNPPKKQTPILGRNIRFGYVLKERPMGSVKSPKDLECSNFLNLCRWRNLGQGLDQLNWFQAYGRLNFYSLFACTGKIGMPREPYAVMASNLVRRSTDHGVLVSDPLPCQKGNATLKLRYWTSPGVELLVCVKRLDIPYPNFDYCTTAKSKFGPASAEFDLPGPFDVSFEIFIKASNFVFETTTLRGGYAIIDDISFQGEFCTKKPESPSFGTPNCDLQYFYCIPELCADPSRLEMNQWCRQCGFCTRFVPKMFTKENKNLTKSSPKILTTTKKPKMPPTNLPKTVTNRQFPLKCPKGFSKWNQRFTAMGLHEPTNLCYKKLKTPMTWLKAKEACAREGAILPSFRNLLEAVHYMSFTRLALKELETWIGLQDESNDSRPDDERWDDTYVYSQKHLPTPNYRWEYSKPPLKAGCAVANKWKMRWKWVGCSRKQRVVCQTRLSLLPLYWNFPLQRYLLARKA